jgi:hypothetical protein
MKTKIMFVLMAFSIVAWVGTGSAADRPTASSDAGQGSANVSEPNRADIAIWCQDQPLLSGNGSQIAPDYPFESWVADDYTSPGDEAIEKVRWWGVFYDVIPIPVIQPDYFVISFYDPTGNCNPGLAGTIPETAVAPIFQRIVTVYNAIDSGDGVHFEYTADLSGLSGDPDAPVPQDAGRTYWISIQAGDMDYFVAGQWGWSQNAASLLCPAVQLFPAAGLDIWTPLNVDAADAAFCLYYVDEPIAVEASTWGSVKALYK